MVRGIAQALPVLPGQDDVIRQFTAEAATSRALEHRASRRRAGITREVVALQWAPAQTLCIAYLEADDPESAVGKMVASEVEYDVEFVELITRTTGVDPAHTAAAPPVELIYDIRPKVFHDDPFGLFAFPLPLASTDAWYDFNEDVLTTRGPDVRRSREALGWYEAVFLQHTPTVELVICVAQGPNAPNCVESIVRSTNPFDEAFMRRIAELHQIDFTAGPLPTSEIVFTFDDRDDRRD